MLTEPESNIDPAAYALGTLVRFAVPIVLFRWSRRFARLVATVGNDTPEPEAAPATTRDLYGTAIAALGVFLFVTNAPALLAVLVTKIRSGNTESLFRQPEFIGKLVAIVLSITLVGHLSGWIRLIDRFKRPS